MDDRSTCTATHVSPTAGQDLTVRCGLPAGHEPADDHEAWSGPFPIRWRQQLNHSVGDGPPHG